MKKKTGSLGTRLLASYSTPFKRLVAVTLAPEAKTPRGITELLTRSMVARPCQEVTNSMLDKLACSVRGKKLAS